MKIKCASCGVERSQGNLVAVYRKHHRRFDEVYSEVANVYICASSGTCRKNRKESRKNIVDTDSSV